MSTLYVIYSCCNLIHHIVNVASSHMFMDEIHATKILKEIYGADYSLFF